MKRKKLRRRRAKARAKVVAAKKKVEAKEILDVVAGMTTGVGISWRNHVDELAAVLALGRLVTTIDPGLDLIFDITGGAATGTQYRTGDSGQYEAPDRGVGRRPDVGCLGLHRLKSTGNAVPIRSMPPKL